MSELTLALIQANLAWNDLTPNIEKAQKMCDLAVQQGANFIILPETFTTGFSLETGSVAREAGIGARGFLDKFARQNGVTIMGSAPFLPDSLADATQSLLESHPKDADVYDKPFNCLSIYGPSGYIANYSKIHLFNYQREGERYQAGSDIIQFAVNDWKVTPFVCYDMRFSNLFFNTAKSTNLYVIVANWPITRTLHWRSLAIARAIETQSFVAAVNRVGEGKNGLKFGGDSLLVAPDGQILLDGCPRSLAVNEKERLAQQGLACGYFEGYGEWHEAVLVKKISLDTLINYRNSFPFLEDQRADIQKKFIL